MRNLFLVFSVLFASNFCAIASDTVPLSGKSKSPETAKPSGPPPYADEAQGEDDDKPFIASLDTYGSTRISEAIIKKYWGKELEAWLLKGLSGDQSALSDEAKLIEKIQKKFHFAFADWSAVEYFEEEGQAVHITLDVVEPQDVALRMAFLPKPTADLKDPASLLKQWNEYQKIALDLVDKGDIAPESETCPTAFHCPFGHKHEKLKSYEKIFTEGVRKHSKELAKVFVEDKREENRAAAAFLLAYLKDGKELVQTLVPGIKDPSDMVRNNALRVLADVAEFHPDIPVPIKPITEAFYFPRVSDRSKSLSVAMSLANNSAPAREELMKHVPVLFQMMACLQPDHREIAHLILKKISGKDFAPTDTKNWDKWYASVSKDRSLTKK